VGTWRLKSKSSKGYLIFEFLKNKNDVDFLALKLCYIQGNEFKASKVVFMTKGVFQLYCIASSTSSSITHNHKIKYSLRSKLLVVLTFLEL
jgi:hypothetical protein